MALAARGGKSGTVSRTGERRGRGFRSAAETARRRLGEAAAGHGFAEPDVLMHWPEVVGERLAGLCVPVRVSYPRNHDLGATLVVRAPGARAPEVEHLGPRIIERVNQFYGYRAIGQLKVTQTTAPGGFAEDRMRFAGPEPDDAAEPDAAVVARAAALTTGIESDALRAALARMGAHVLSRAAAPDKD